MDILTALRFVRGAISTKNLVPEMSHFAIEGGRVRAYNGLIALSSPLDFAVDCLPKAMPLVQAIINCEDVVTLRLTPHNRLLIQSGLFRANIECLEGSAADAPHFNPEGETIQIEGGHLLAAVDKLKGFVGNDASRPWTNGILFHGQSAYATNNVCLVEYWLGTPFPRTVNVPLAAIKEIDRIGLAPTHIQVSENSITFHYEDGRWLRSQLYETTWPDVTKILNGASNPQPIPPQFFPALGKIAPFADRKSEFIYFVEGGMTTSLNEEDGAYHAVEGLTADGLYKASMLRKLEGIAVTADFTTYPKPVYFFGDRLRGAIIGLRK